MTSCHLREALEIGAERFNWGERVGRDGQRRGSKVIGVGVGVGNFGAGALGFDGLMTLQPDGRRHVPMVLDSSSSRSTWRPAR